MSMFQVPLAHAQAAGAAPAPTGIQAIFASPITMLVIIFVIFYFLLIRPQQKKQKEHQEMLNKLGKGDKVITNGGIYGTIAAIGEDGVIHLQVDEKVKIRIARGAIADKTTI
jgi:preprotein translocase subunit YajC